MTLTAGWVTTGCNSALPCFHRINWNVALACGRHESNHSLPPVSAKSPPYSPAGTEKRNSCAPADVNRAKVASDAKRSSPELPSVCRVSFPCKQHALSVKGDHRIG